MSHLALPAAPALPRRIYVEPEAAAIVPLVAEAIAIWHARLRGGLFRLVGFSQDADVRVRLSGETWVDMLASPMVLRWNTEGAAANVLTMQHELCHTLGLGDHLPESWRALVLGRGYVNVQFDDFADPAAYRGIANSLDVPFWWSAQDAAMLSTHWPLAHRETIPEVSHQ